MVNKVTENNNSNELFYDEEDNHDKLDLRGTLVMVLLLGGLMVISWSGAFILFLSRM